MREKSDYAATLLRVTLGLFFLVHDSVKIFVFTPAGTAAFFGKLGLPPALAYAVILAEGLGGIALILGAYTRIAAIILAADMIGALVTVHLANGFLFTDAGGGWEYPAMWTVALIALALLGNGAYALPLGKPAAPRTA